MPYLLKPDAKIAVIGAGPAGSFFSYFALKKAKEKKINTLRVKIFDYKKFAQSGPKACNLCAGVIQSNFSQKLLEIGLELPQEVIQRKVSGYIFHTSRGDLELPGSSNIYPIITVYRGNGPLFFSHMGNISFDDALLNLAKSEGAEALQALVIGLEKPALDKLPRITYKIKEKIFEEEFDLIAGAFGLNTKMLGKIEGLNFGFRSPKMRRAFQTELHLGKEFIKNLKGEIHIFALGIKGISFAAFIPKEEHCTLTLIGNKDLNLNDLQNFLRHPKIIDFLPKGWKIPEYFCSCQPWIAVSPALKPFFDRLVIIGDANCNRYYKNGIESAYYTALFAAETVLGFGIDRVSLEKYFYTACKKELIIDNYFGKVFFILNSLIAKVPFITRAHLTLGKGNNKVSKIERRILWGIFTGAEKYRDLFFESLNPLLILNLLFYSALYLLKDLKNFIFKGK
ncbi:MAG: hypothetical protein HYU63_05435 [Armatimonadetes bacterium]|nr:hypothetical protein [Armatimonadota bacterium]